IVGGNVMWLRSSTLRWDEDDGETEYGSYVQQVTWEDLGPIDTIGAYRDLPFFGVGHGPDINNFKKFPPIVGSVWIQLRPGVGISIPFAVIPASGKKCLGAGLGVGGPSSGAIVGPVWGKGDPESVLSGWSVSLSGAFSGGGGGQWMHNMS